ncbi:hypothetical protein [uncultured Amphritea sp.]|uniref:hypothetical protein n=1 Tax=uncultured Amphritea sp. TaxID=981605 RepID=UPI00261DDD2E|nr:hypothetical protein [uncultured Amphritea sp.]
MQTNPKTIGFHPCGRQGCDKKAETRTMIKGRNHYLYSVCPACKVDQSTGAILQTYLWNHTEWLDGEPEVSPPNLIEAAAKIEAETSETEIDLFDPEALETEPEAVQAAKVPLLAKVLLGGLALGLTVMGVSGAMSNMKAVK